MTPPRLYDPQLLRLLTRVTADLVPAYASAFPRKTIAGVSITMMDGSRYDSGPVEAIWQPPDTMASDAALENKFLWLAGPIIGNDDARALARLIWEFEHCPSVAPLLQRCVSKL